MKNSIHIICVVVLLAFITLGDWGELAPSRTLGQDTEIPQLVGQDVLRILAIPLPENVNRGYFLVNVDISGANLTGVNLDHAQLDFSDFSNTDIDFGQLVGASANQVDFSNASLSDANLDDGTFSFSRLYRKQCGVKSE